MPTSEANLEATVLLESSSPKDKTTEINRPNQESVVFSLLPLNYTVEVGSQLLAILLKCYKADAPSSALAEPNYYR